MNGKWVVVCTRALFSVTCVFLNVIVCKSTNIVLVKLAQHDTHGDFLENVMKKSNSFLIPFRFAMLKNV